jgi:hypothetical protein
VPTRDLIDGIAARRGSVSSELLAEVHEVRDYRNQIVHHGLISSRWAFVQCRSRLSRFLACLSDEW